MLPVPVAPAQVSSTVCAWLTGATGTLTTTVAASPSYHHVAALAGASRAAAGPETRVAASERVGSFTAWERTDRTKGARANVL